MAKKAVPVFLAKLLVPGGAFLSAAEGIYSGIMTFVDRGKEILAVGTAFFHSVQQIASGQFDQAAAAVESTLAKIIPVALAFLAKWLHLDGITDKIQEGLAKVRRPVEEAVDTLLDKVTEKAIPIWERIKAGMDKLVDKGKALVGGVLGKVKGWFSLREEFELSNHEKHCLFFDKAGQLIVASDPTPYVDFIRYLAIHSGKDKKAALDLSNLIKNNTVKLNILLAKRESDVKKALASGLPIPLPVAAEAADIQRLEKENTDQLKKLAKETLKLMEQNGGFNSGHPLVGHPDYSPDSQQPFYASQYKGEFSGGMHATYDAVYMKNTQKQLISAGSSTKGSGSTPIFDVLSTRLSGGISYCMKGHMLSQQLHGSGTDWHNLTPLSRSGNSLHETRVESQIKDVALDIRKKGALGPRYFYYSVVPHYNRQPNLKLLEEVKTHSKRSQLEPIIEMEQHVPTSLTCAIREIVKPNSTATGITPITPTEVNVPNKIENENLNDYVVK